MKHIVGAVIFMTGISVTYAADKADITAGPERDRCWHDYSDRGKASECLHELSDKSNKKMDAMITATARQIKENNTGPVFRSNNPQRTIGDDFSKFFLASQNSWKAYRKNFCLGVGSQIGEDAWDYWPYIYQCQINLNQRHAEEIKMLRADEE
ncbi:DUF1311 domain-containing protein [Kosakonia sp.]|uniref:DUF1311 domain-containing protein n=1 Tax=Kosakonia sp. TaxID=1916651 RepID=UPI0028980D85|nr:DUF1311 domain-containing protein [Kosakonia sp.]